MGNAVQLSRGIVNTIQTLKTDTNYIITYDSEAYELRHGVEVIGVEEFVRGMGDNSSDLLSA